MFAADQFVAHLVGDYILQSHWMATEKTKRSIPAAIHAVCYTLPFLLITRSPVALAIICGTHFVIDRWRLARFLVWLKNGPVHWVYVPGGVSGWDWKPLTATGYQDDVPAWLSVSLLIITDNTLHIICNAFAIWIAS